MKNSNLVLGLFSIALVFLAGFLLGRVSVPVPGPIPKPPSKGVSPAPRLPVFPKGQGKIAIVLDDWGYSLQQVKLLSAIRQPLTVAILPNLPYSTEVARAAHSQGHEVILHQPMEAFDEREPKESATITAGMPAGEALRTLRQCLATVPFASGISNHQGSRATSDSRLMQTLLSEVRRQGLYFLDSRVTAESVGMQMARSLRVRFIRRSVFIDNEKSPDEIRERLGELAKLAQKRGSALGIGHDRPNTLRVLLEAAPALERAGYTLVPASELAEIPGDVVS